MNPIEQILQQRTAGRATCATMKFNDNSAPQSQADRIALAHGLRALGEGWLAVSAHDAHAIGLSVLHRDLAYGTEIMPRAEAMVLAEALYDLVPEPHTYYTNGDWADALNHDGDELGVAFDPLSDATFDAGVICVGDGVAAILWVEDED